jgi:hypothetical protein
MVRDGMDLSEDDVFRLCMQREGVRGASELIVYRDEEGRPRPAREVVHRGGILQKSLVPLEDHLHAIAAEGTREKHAAWLLRASSCISGIVAQAIELRDDEGSWIPDYIVVTKPFSIILLEVKAVKWFGIEERARLRRFFAHARDRGLHPVLWTDEWLKRHRVLRENLVFLHKRRTQEVSPRVEAAIKDLIARHAEVRLDDFVQLGRPQVLTSVYALLALERIHADLTLPKARWVLRNEAFSYGGMIHGKDQLFAGPDL